MQHAKPRFRGVEVELGGQLFTVPPLSLGQLEEHEDVIATLSQVDGESMFASFYKAIPFMHAAFSRNYPEMTREQLAELIDFNSFNEVLQAVMNASGLKRVGEPSPVAAHASL